MKLYREKYKALNKQTNVNAQTHNVNVLSKIFVEFASLRKYNENEIWVLLSFISFLVYLTVLKIAQHVEKVVRG